MLGDSGPGPIDEGGGPGRTLAFGVAFALVLGGVWFYWQPALSDLSAPAQIARPADPATNAATMAAAIRPERRASYVIDSGQILSERAVSELNRELGDLNVQSGPQVLVMSVSSLNGSSIEDYTLRVANQWGIGDPAREDGVLLLVAPNDRKVRIEVAKGLQGVLTNDLCAEIIREVMLPLFRAGKLEEATLAGASRIAAVLRANPTLPGGIR